MPSLAIYAIIGSAIATIVAAGPIEGQNMAQRRGSSAVLHQPAVTGFPADDYLAHARRGYLVPRQEASTNGTETEPSSAIAQSLATSEAPEVTTRAQAMGASEPEKGRAAENQQAGVGQIMAEASSDITVTTFISLPPDGQDKGVVMQTAQNPPAAMAPMPTPCSNNMAAAPMPPSMAQPANALSMSPQAGSASAQVVDAPAKAAAAPVEAAAPAPAEIAPAPVQVAPASVETMSSSSKVDLSTTKAISTTPEAASATPEAASATPEAASAATVPASATADAASPSTGTVSASPQEMEQAAANIDLSGIELSSQVMLGFASSTQNVTKPVATAR